MGLRHLVAVIFVLLATTSARADENAPSTNEYNAVPPGLLLTPTQRANIKSPQQQPTQEEEDNASLDPQILTHSLNVFDAKPQNSGSVKIISMPQIEEAYAKGNYADILLPLEENVEQNEPQAALLLGIMYDQGQGVAVDPKRAAQLYTRAAEANLPQAQHRLALQYYQGRGVTKDVITAMKWLHIACSTYKDGPQKARAIMDRKNLDAAMTRKDRDTAYFMAREWMTKKGIVHLLDAQQSQP